VPIYEYACKHCAHTLDALQKMSDDPLVDCPDCGKPALKRLLSAPRFRLKGQGWYETDFKQDNRRNVVTADADKGDDKKAKTDDGKSSDGKATDAKPIDSKSSDSKATDSKATDSKGTDSKPKSDTGAGKSGSGKTPKSASAD
jgi:putative FmdB family regulatory protein